MGIFDNSGPSQPGSKIGGFFKQHLEPVHDLTRAVTGTVGYGLKGVGYIGKGIGYVGSKIGFGNPSPSARSIFNGPSRVNPFAPSSTSASPQGALPDSKGSLSDVNWEKLVGRQTDAVQTGTVKTRG